MNALIAFVLTTAAHWTLLARRRHNDKTGIATATYVRALTVVAGALSFASAFWVLGKIAFVPL